jgi:hypothetical protein
MVLGVSGTLTPPLDCVACALGKRKRHSFLASKTPKSIIPGEVTSFDYWGPMRTITPSGKRGFLGCIDQASGYLSPVLVNRKSDCLQAIQYYDAYLTAKFGSGLKIIRTDNGGEFKSKAFDFGPEVKE